MTSDKYEKLTGDPFLEHVQTKHTINLKEYASRMSYVFITLNLL
jgi:hypothetical protein